MVCKRFDHIRYADLEDHVHTALEVEAQANSHLAALLESPRTEVNLVVEQRIHVVVCRVLPFCGNHLLVLALVVVSYYGEAHIEDTYQSQQYCEKLHKSFVLHCLVDLLFLLFFPDFTPKSTQIYNLFSNKT